MSFRSARKEARQLLEETEYLLKRGGSQVPEIVREEAANQTALIRKAVEAKDEAALQSSVETLNAMIEKHLAHLRKGKVQEYVESIGVAVAVALFLRAFLFEAFQIPSPSMESTLLVGDFLFVNKAAYGVRVPFTTKYLGRWDEIDRGEVVVFAFPVEEVATQYNLGRMKAAADTWVRVNQTQLPSLDALKDTLPPQAFLDGWGNPYRFGSIEGGGYSIVSGGADGVFGNDDDLTNHNSAFRYGPSSCLKLDSLTSRKDYIKRVIGLPGDRVRMKDYVLYVNDVPISREVIGQGPYGVTIARETMDNGHTYNVQTFAGGGPDFEEITVRPGHIFAMGDNRDNSSDGRCWGQVPIGNVKGSAMFMFFSRGAEGKFGVRWNRIFDPVI